MASQDSGSEPPSGDLGGADDASSAREIFEGIRRDMARASARSRGAARSRRSSTPDVSGTDDSSSVDQRERHYVVEHDGQRIVVNDYSGLAGEALVRQIILFRQTIRRVSGEDLRVLVRSDSPIVVHREALDEFLVSSKEFKGKFSKTAIVGASGLQSILINTINRVANLGARAFDDELEAKHWLVE